MPTDKSLRNIHVFPTEDSFNQNASSVGDGDLALVPLNIPEQVNADWNASSGAAQILNKPNLATVATSGNYNDLSNRPNLATVATSGSYNDLTNKPTIPSNPNDYVTSTYRSGSSWYRIWSNGLIEQGGQISPTSAGEIYVTYPKKFSTTVAPVVGFLGHNDTTTVSFRSSAYSPSSAGFYIYSKYSGTKAGWYAAGY